MKKILIIFVFLLSAATLFGQVQRPTEGGTSVSSPGGGGSDTDWTIGTNEISTQNQVTIAQDTSIYAIDVVSAGGYLIYLEVAEGDLTGVIPDSIGIKTDTDNSRLYYTDSVYLAPYGETFQTAIRMDDAGSNGVSFASSELWVFIPNTGTLNVDFGINTDSVDADAIKIDESLTLKYSGGPNTYTGNPGIAGVTYIGFDASYGNVLDLFPIGTQVTMIGGTDDGTTVTISGTGSFFLSATFFPITPSLTADDYTGFSINTFAGGTIYFANDSTAQAASIYMEYDSTLKVDLPEDKGISFGIIDMDTSATVLTHKAGRLHWNSDDNSLDVDTEISGTSIQLGQEQVIRVVNKTGSLIPNGTVVYIDSVQGNRPTIGLADPTDSDIMEHVIGLTTADIADNAEGYVTTQGLVRDINTSDYAVGDVMYASEDVPGNFTDTVPSYLNIATRVGYVTVSHASQGTILVSVARVHCDIVYGEMYFSEPDTISTATTNWYSPTKWTAGSVLGTSVVGDSAMVVTQNGKYFVSVSPSFKHSGSNVLIHYAVFLNDVLQISKQSERTIGTTPNQFGASSLSGIISIDNAPDTVQVKVNADKTGDLISNHNNVTIYKIH